MDSQNPEIASAKNVLKFMSTAARIKGFVWNTHSHTLAHTNANIAG